MDNTDKFISMMRKRLKTGKKTYGKDSHLTRDLVKDMEEELTDFANYALLLYDKIQRLRK